MMVTSPRLAAKARSSAGTNTGKASPIERLATPSTKHSATSNHGTKRLIAKFPSHGPTLASAVAVLQFSRRGGQALDTITIALGFNGPRLSGNGGYVGGVLAERYTRA